jgi:uncharacterized protein
MFLDPMYFIFLIPGLLLSLWAQSKVKGSYQRYSQMANSAGLTGAQSARRILDNAGLQGVGIEAIPGELTDHYDPRHRVLRLSQQIYGTRSVAAMAVAAHEAGHALQHAQGYAPLKFRTAIVPVVNIGSNLGFILLFAGIIIGITELAWLGVGLFALATVFAFITLPVEFNASARAKQQLVAMGMTGPQDADAVNKMLSAAAWTYIAAFIVSVLQLLYWVSAVRRSS